jgi:hypothetical protein
MHPLPARARAESSILVFERNETALESEEMDDDDRTRTGSLRAEPDW